MLIDFVGGSFAQKYTAFDPERTINWLPVASTDAEKSISRLAFFSTPGLSTFSSPSGTNMRGLYTARTHASLTPGKCFTVIDRTLYQLSTSGTATSRGTLTNITNDTTPVYFTCNAADELGIFHSSAGYVLNMTTNTLTQITDADYPSTVTSVDFMDGFVFVSITSGAVYWTNVNDLLTGWDALNVLSPTSTPSATIAIRCFNQQLYCFTEDGIDVYTNASGTLTRLPRTTSLIGLIAKDSIVKTTDGLVFLGRSKHGEAAIYMIDNNYQCKQISTSSITWKLNNTSSDLVNSYAHIQYNKEGHILYFITIPGTSTTLVYDLTTSLWHERNSKNPNDSTEGAFRGRYYTNFDSKNLYGDLYGASVMKEDYTVFTEDGTGAAQTITRTRISPKVSHENVIIAVHELEICCNSGASNSGSTDAQIAVSYAKDANGSSFNTARNVKVGTQGTGTWRPKLTMLGSARWWTLKLVLTGPIDLCITDIIAHGSYWDRSADHKGNV